MNVRPPAQLPAEPVRDVLPAGTVLYRLHSARRPATGFNPEPADCFYGGGRFDATRLDDYGFLYAGLTSAAAVCESLLRSVPFTADAEPRLIPRAAVRGRRVSFLRLGEDVTVVPLLSGRDLSAVAQDSWLVHAEAAEYPFTRNWCHWIRRQTSLWGQGLRWRSKREPDDHVVILFADRCTDRTLTEAGPAPIDLDTAPGERWLNTVLEPYRAQVAP